MDMLLSQNTVGEMWGQSVDSDESRGKNSEEWCVSSERVWQAPHRSPLNQREVKCKVGPGVGGRFPPLDLLHSKRGVKFGQSESRIA